ncbi:MAG: glycoside hydrolase family 88 protein [Clostridia bacterium]|nr:glycoside hydrolase family 88 protein [Clostridia bacterium]
MLKEYLPGSAVLMAESFMKKFGLLTARWSYDYGVMWRGMEALHRLTGEQKYFDYIREAMDTFVSADGSIRDYTFDSFNLDYICDGRQALYLWKATGEEKYRKAADMLREQLRRQPRTSDGGFWHKKCYPYQMWLDGLHMSAPFYTEYCLMTGDEDGVQDAARQLQLAYRHTLEPATGLNHHAWDESRAQLWSDPETGRAAHCWGRAVGWYMLGLADVLELLPPGHACRADLEKIACSMSEKLLSVRDGGVWLQVIDQPGRAGNYRESSGSCLMVAAMLKLARLGCIPAEMGDAAAESFRALQREFVGRMRDGTMFLAKTCFGAGLGGQPGKYRDGSYDYYISEAVGSWDIKGTGAYIQAAVEYEIRSEA